MSWLTHQRPAKTIKARDMKFWGYVRMSEYRCAKKGFCKILILKGKNGVCMTFMFLRFSRPQIRYRLRNCNNIFFIKYLKPISAFFETRISRVTKRVKRGYLRRLYFWHFLGRKIRYHFRNCTKTFFIQIRKNQFLHFSKFEPQGAQRVDFKGLIRVSVTLMFLRFSRPQNKIPSLELY